MTLSTNIYVLDPISPQEVFLYCQTLLQKYDEPDHLTPQQQDWVDEPADGWRADSTRWSIRNHLGQGLPAILDVDYRPNGPLTTKEQSEY